MKKINAYPGQIRWNKSVYNPELIISFRRKEDYSSEWSEIHIKLTTDVVKDISIALKKYISEWWKSQLETIDDIKKHLNF